MSECVREMQATFAPAAAKARAEARPIPRPAPVRRMTLPFRVPANLEGEM